MWARFAHIFFERGAHMAKGHMGPIRVPHGFSHMGPNSDES